MVTEIMAWLKGRIAVWVCLLWFIWDALTALSYIDSSPPQLQRIESWLSIPIWVVWSIAAGFLLVGILIPVKRSERMRDTAIVLRGIGMVMSSILLALWGMGFIFSDFERGWVTGKNYLMLAALGMISGYLVSRLSVREG